MSKSWYVLNSYSGYENKAKEQLLERITLNGMEDFFGKIEVPSEEITEMKGGKEKRESKPHNNSEATITAAKTIRVV